jgi:ribosome-associated protein
LLLVLSICGATEEIMPRKSEKTTLAKIPPALDRVMAAAKVASENKGRDVLILDVRELTRTFDYFLIVSGSSRRQLYAIGDEIQRKLVREMGDECMSVSGHAEGKWIVIDYGDIVVHLFEPETRQYYALEELWGKGIAVNWI